MQRASHGVLDPRLQRRHLTLRAELIDGLVEGVHEHEDVVGADAEDDEDDEKVDKLEEGDLEYDAEEENATKMEKTVIAIDTEEMMMEPV